jgi:2-dehydro-3-deoxyphosphogluconate aldolase/(4S)-4-hydroxy-2-oxoglutarate aldolase
MLFCNNLLQNIMDAKIVAGYTANNPDDAVSIAKALYDGGIKAIEFTLRTESSLEGMKKICSSVPDIIKGVGTILNYDQLISCKDAGADFGVAPGLNTYIIESAEEINFSFAPGIVTPSELETALSFGCKFVKFFPAEASGGITFLKSMAAPYKHHDIKYFPLGGINEFNMFDYLSEDIVAAVGGSWIVSTELVNDKNWKAIRNNAEKISNLINA